MYSVYELTSAKGAVEICNVTALSNYKFLKYYKYVYFDDGMWA